MPDGNISGLRTAQEERPTFAARIVCDRCHAVTNTEVSYKIESIAGSQVDQVESRRRWPIYVDLCGECHDRITDLILTLCSRPDAFVQIPNTENPG